MVEVGGVGYSVVVAPTTAVSLGAIGDEVFVWVHHHVREDAQTLYGFAGRDEKTTFVALIGAHGVGPALAVIGALAIVWGCTCWDATGYRILSIEEAGGLQRIP